MANFRRERRETRERELKLTLTLPCKVRQGWGKGSAICKFFWWLEKDVPNNFVVIGDHLGVFYDSLGVILY